MPSPTYLYDRERICFGSDVLKWVRYSTKHNLLYVHTLKGATYRYTGVPDRVFQSLPNYGSAGNWWNQEVKRMGYGSTSLGVDPSFRNTEAEVESQSSDSVAAKYTAVVEFTGPLSFTVRGDDVQEALQSLDTLLEGAGFKGKYKVKEVKQG